MFLQQCHSFGNNENDVRRSRCSGFCRKLILLYHSTFTPYITLYNIYIYAYTHVIRYSLYWHSYFIISICVIPKHNNERSCSSTIFPPDSKKGVRHSPTGITIIHLLLPCVSITLWLFVRILFCIRLWKSHLLLLNFRPDFTIYLWHRLNAENGYIVMFCMIYYLSKAILFLQTNILIALLAIHNVLLFYIYRFIIVFTGRGP